MSKRSRVSIRSAADLLVADLVEFREVDGMYHVLAHRSGVSSQLFCKDGVMLFPTFAEAERVVRRYYSGVIQYPRNAKAAPLPDAEAGKAG